MKKTPWFPGHVKPARVGVYERNGPAGTHSYWTGKFWMLGAWGADAAADWDEWPLNAPLSSGWQDLPWRGLTTKDGK
jgi:hypothetical protein